MKRSEKKARQRAAVGASIPFATHLKFKCPFCADGIVEAGYTKHPTTGKNVPAVSHTEPTCADFMKDEAPDVFLRRARLKMRATKPN